MGSSVGSSRCLEWSGKVVRFSSQATTRVKSKTARQERCATAQWKSLTQGADGGKSGMASIADINYIPNKSSLDEIAKLGLEMLDRECCDEYRERYDSLRLQVEERVTSGDRNTPRAQE